MEPSVLNRSQKFAGVRARTLLLFCALFFVVISSALAQEQESSIANMEPVVVVGTVESGATGKSSLSREQIEALPTGDGHVEDLARLSPGVQLSDESNPSFLGGEILPPLISISGGRPYDNNFMIDGMGNNSLLDPLADNVNSISSPPGHPNEIFLNTNLIQNVDIYDNNIPTRFGGFTGGVIDVQTIDPSPEFYTNVSYKTTRSSWGGFHVHEDDYDTFVNSDSHFRQPRFVKHDTGVILNVPVTDRTGVILSYNRLYSKIPLYLIDRTQDQRRESENILLKAVYRPDEINKLTIQFIDSPYTGSYFTKETADSAFDLEGGGRSLTFGYESDALYGTLSLDAGFRENENSRSAPKDFFRWANSPSKDWGVLLDSLYSKEGGFGSIETTQKTREINIDWLSNPIETGSGTHQLNLGVQWSAVEGTYDRPADTYSFNTSVPAQVPPPGLVSDPSISCVPGDLACITAEQYLRRRIVYPAGYSRAEIDTVAVYAEDSWEFGRFELRPGVRFSYDDLMENSNVAPRLTGSFDVMQNGNTVFIAGWNRYYGQTLLTYKLREGIAPTRFEDRIDSVSPWIEYNALTSQTQFSSLETPYADEMVAGVEQVLLGGVADLRYVQRKNRDQFAQERDPFGTLPFRNYRLNNNGSSEYESVRLKWERYWEKHYLSMNATYQETSSSNESYDDNLELDDFDPDKRIWFDGELLWPDELPRENFNRPVVASMVYSALLPHGVTFTNVVNYRSGYHGIVDSGDTIDIGGILHDIYEEVSRPSATIFDWKIGWAPHYLPDDALTLTLEVLNVFNKKAHIADATDKYELGRQFWLGAEYRF